MRTTLFILLSIISMVRAGELLPSSTPPWPCYTGIGADGHSNSFTTIGYELGGDFLRQHEPEPQSDSFRWIPIRSDTRVTVELIAVVHSKQLWRAIYRSTKPDVPENRPEAAAFLLTTAEGHLRPFFILFPDATESFESYLESSPELPFSLTARTDMSGTGVFYSIYSFSFTNGLPHFLGRTDGGRHNEPKTYK